MAVIDPYLDAYTDLYGSGSEFPLSPLGITVELLLNGTWTDISSYVYQRNDISITYGRPDETQQIQPASLTLTLNNQAGNFSPQNTAGLYYPYIGRNVQIRVSVNASASDGTTYSGYRFWGEVSSWPPQWDVTGTDVYVDIEAGGILRRYVQGSLIGSPLKRFYLLKTDATAPVAMWTCEEQSGASQFSSALPNGSAMTWTGTPSLASDSNFLGTDPIPLLSGSQWTGNTGTYSSSGPVTYSSPGTYTFTCPGAVTSLSTVECWGAGGGGSNARANDANNGGGAGGGGEYAKETSVAVTPGNDYTVTVGAGGSGGYYATVGGGQNPGSPGGASSFPGDSITVTAHGGNSGNMQNGGTGGTGSSNTTHFKGGNGGTHTGTGTGHYGGAGGGSSGGTTSAGNVGGSNNGSNGGGLGGAAVSGGGKGGAGGPGGTLSTNPRVSGGSPGAVPGGGGGGGGESTSDHAGFAGGSGGSGQVKLNYTSSTTPNNVVIRFLLDVPSTGAGNGVGIVRGIVASGTLAKIDCIYGTGGSLQYRGLNSGGGTVFDTGPVSFGVNGKQVMVSMELVTSGSNVNCNINVVQPGGTQSGFNTSFTGTIGAISQIQTNVGGGITDTGVGFIVLQYALEPLNNVSQALNGFNGELAAVRFERLCSEEGFTSVLSGTTVDTPQMGPQTDQKFTDVLQEIEDADQGQIFELTTGLGLGYRTRVDMQNQAAVITLDYSLSHLSESPVPTYDDQLTRNDVTVSRVNGGSTSNQLTTGSLSILTPPNGVGDYSYSLNANLNADTQLVNIAQWILDKGTVDEYRYPQITVDMSRSEVTSLFNDVPSLNIGDFLEIVNPPSWLPAGPIKQLQWGRSETLNAFRWVFVYNCVPESPYEGVLPSW